VVCAKCINGCSYFSSWQLNLREQPEENSFFIRGFTKDAQCNIPEQDTQITMITRIPSPRGQSSESDS
jgi:hypothetical protein